MLALKRTPARWQDKADDVHAGVKSTALLFGDATKPWLTAFGVGTIGLLGAAGGAPCRPPTHLWSCNSRGTRAWGISRPPGLLLLLLPFCSRLWPLSGRRCVGVERHMCVAREPQKQILTHPAVCAQGCVTGCGAPFYAGLGAAAAHLAWQIRTVDLDSRPDCLAKFQSNKVTISSNPPMALAFGIGEVAAVWEGSLRCQVV